MRAYRPWTALFALLLLAACDEAEVAAPPAPMQLTRDAIGYYCNMTVIDHPGPKGQIFVKGQDRPVWFSSVRDAVAFTMLPGEPKQLSAVYVHDAGRMASWKAPGDATWIAATGAHYVIGSRMKGGMGLPEAVPFSDPDRAAAFAARHGGHVVAWKEIPRGYIINASEDHKGRHDDHGGGHDRQHDGPKQPQAHHDQGQKDG
ncbi:MAG: nitrous oxide reductase accessory protein NosL [Alphaproteobacteria bacterium]|jgi:copper chaperone NosL|nr:nitrous oxide reductase accessory protein NosL [Alphaproteobacteria bacterium]